MISNITLAVVISVLGLAYAIKIQHFHHDLEDHHEALEHYSPVEHYAPLEHKEKHHIPIIKHEFKQSKDGYQFSYQGGNGIHAEETGYIKNDGDKKHGSLVQKGSISYHDEHGHPIVLTYIADEHGFRPQGDHLPTPPPLPIEHLKAIAEHNAHNAAHSGHQEELSHQYGGEELLHHYGHL